MRAPDRYIVIGNPVAHGKSPHIHAAFAEQTGQNLSDERLLAPLDGFVATVRNFIEQGGKGMSVTVPFNLVMARGASRHGARIRGIARERVMRLPRKTQALSFTI